MRGNIWGACLAALFLITTGGCDRGAAVGPPDSVTFDFSEDVPKVQPKGVSTETTARTPIGGQRDRTPIFVDRDRERTPISASRPSPRHEDIMAAVRAMDNRKPIELNWRPMAPDIEPQPMPSAPEFTHEIVPLEWDDTPDVDHPPIAAVHGFLDGDEAWMEVDLSAIEPLGNLHVVRWIDGRKWTDVITQRSIRRNAFQRIPSGDMHIELTEDVVMLPAHWRRDLPDELEAFITGAMPDRLDDPIELAEPERIGLPPLNFQQAQMDIQPLARNRIDIRIGDPQQWVPVARFRVTNLTPNNRPMTMHLLSFDVGESWHHSQEPRIDVREVPPLFTGQCRSTVRLPNGQVVNHFEAYAPDGQGLDGQRYATVDFVPIDNAQPIRILRGQFADVTIECLTSEDIGDGCVANPFAEQPLGDCGIGPNGERTYKFCVVGPNATWNSSPNANGQFGLNLGRYVFTQEASVGGDRNNCNDSGTIRVLPRR